MTRPINQVTTMRLPDGQNVAFVDWSDRPLYSTCDILHGATDERIPLFNYVSSDSVSGSQNLTVKRTATDRDTNISTPGAMASTEEMLVYAIKPEYTWLATDSQVPSNATTAQPRFPFDPQPKSNQLAALFQLMLLELRVSQKTMHQAPLAYYNSGFGVFGSFWTGAGVATPTGAPSTAGLPSQEAVRSLAIRGRPRQSERCRTRHRPGLARDRRRRRCDEPPRARHHHPRRPLQAACELREQPACRSYSKFDFPTAAR